MKLSFVPFVYKIIVITLGIWVNSYTILSGPKWKLRTNYCAVDGIDSPDIPECKTIIMEHIPNGILYAIVLLKDHNVSNRKLSYLLSTASSELRLAPRKKAEDLTGFLTGSIPPIGFKTHIKTILDIYLFSFEKIFVGSGFPGVQTKVKPFDMLFNGSALVADISESTASDKKNADLYHKILCTMTSSLLLKNGNQDMKQLNISPENSKI